MLLFDLDGTLIDSNGVWLQIDLNFLEKRGLVHTPEYSEAVAHSIFPLAAKFTREYYRLPDTPEEIMAEWMVMAEEAYARTIPLKPGARDFLAQEARKGETLAIVTACVPSACRAALERLDIARYFTDIVFAQELGMEKRDPRFFAEAVRRLGVSAAACTLYEDAPDNCAAAKDAGLTVVGVYDPFFAQSAQQMRTICDRYIERFTELVEN